MKLLRNLAFLCFIAVMGYGFGTAGSGTSSLTSSPSVSSVPQVQGEATFAPHPSSPSATFVELKTATPSPTIKPTQKPTIKPTAKPTPIPTLKPTPEPTTANDGLSNNNYYENSQGNEIHSPAYNNSVPVGATAVCGDGTYSFSQSRRGTCSHHGGVAQWL